MQTLRIHKAIEFASLKHRSQTRKGVDVPFIVHPVEVALILAEYGYGEDLIIAGLLHDTLEDAGADIDEIRTEFGEHVAFLVTGESEDKTKSWEERKQATIDELYGCCDEVAVCTLADKLANVRSLLFDLSRFGESVWTVFNRDKAHQQWYYTSIAKATQRLSNTKLWCDYSAVLGKLFS